MKTRRFILGVLLSSVSAASLAQFNQGQSVGTAGFSQGGSGTPPSTDVPWVNADGVTAWVNADDTTQWIDAP